MQIFLSLVAVFAAPTGCGKTVLFELAILRLLTPSVNGDGTFTHHPGQLKAVRSLLEEQYSCLRKRWSLIWKTHWAYIRNCILFISGSDIDEPGCSTTEETAATLTKKSDEPSPE